MPAESVKQHNFMGLVKAIKEGKANNASPKAEKAAKGMSMKQVDEFASTKEKGLPEKKAAELALVSGLSPLARASAYIDGYMAR